MDNNILFRHSPSILQRQGPVVQRDSLRSQSHQTEVSWQSIFWALVPLALNIMVQPTGQTLGSPKRYALMLRSSPIVCAVGGAVALGTLIHYIRQGGSLTMAVHRLMESRFQASTGGTVQDGLSALLQNTWLRLFLFAGRHIVADG